ncbi:MAG: S9 family peptidase [Candidatus Solibacter usitatus]|nr:S9 family peptidase [Candidatus Solibacter usitatus]
MKGMRFTALASLAVLAALSTLPVAAQKGLEPETLFDMETVSNPAISPDGTAIVFSRGWVDKMKDQHRANLWVISGWNKPGGAKLRELTSGNWRDSAPVWSPDGERIAFLSDRDGTMQAHVMWVDSREVSQLTRLEKAPSNLRWSPDGKRLAFTATVPDEDPALTVKLPKKPEGAQWAKPAVIVDRLSWASDGVGPVPKGFSHIFVIDALTGGTPKQITNGKFNHRDPQWSPDGKTVYCTGIRKPDAEYLRNDSEIYAIDLAGGTIKALTDRKGPDANPAPHGGWIAYTGYDDRKLTSTLSSIYLMDSSGGQKRLWAGALPSSPGELQWNAEGTGVYYTMEEKGSANLYFLPLDGSPRKLTEGVHVLSQASLSRAGGFAAVRSTFHQPGSLVTISAGGKSVREILDVNSDVLEGRALGAVEEMWWESKDGWKVQGWLVKPVGFDPKKKYPLLLYIHGGPWSMYNVGFNWGWQNFAANGYAVLYANPRGSTGYGQEFVSGIQHSYPGRDFDDLMGGVDAALKKGFVDERNLFVCGGSGGGVLTAWIVGHTDRFRAAVSMRPVINWHSFVGTTDGASWYDQFQKKPWEDPAEYAARSPLSYVASVKTPTMVMTGEADLRTPISQSEEYYRALKLLKKETLLVRMPEEFHGWRRPSHQLMQQLYLLAWFEKYRVKDN